MNDFALVLMLLGLIAFSAFFVYFFVWREPQRPPKEKERPARRSGSGERSGECREVGTHE